MRRRGSLLGFTIVAVFLFGASTAHATFPGQNGRIGFIGYENKATVLQVFRYRVNDSGANGTRGDSDDRTFATQGIYIP
jgi:hypothetical protein